jgi:hypothetical protein
MAKDLGEPLPKPNPNSKNKRRPTVMAKEGEIVNKIIQEIVWSPTIGLEKIRTILNRDGIDVSTESIRVFLCNIGMATPEDRLKYSICESLPNGKQNPAFQQILDAASSKTARKRLEEKIGPWDPARWFLIAPDLEKKLSDRRLMNQMNKMVESGKSENPLIIDRQGKIIKGIFQKSLNDFRDVIKKMFSGRPLGWLELRYLFNDNPEDCAVGEKNLGRLKKYFPKVDCLSDSNTQLLSKRGRLLAGAIGREVFLCLGSKNKERYLSSLDSPTCQTFPEGWPPGCVFLAAETIENPNELQALAKKSVLYNERCSKVFEKRMRIQMFRLDRDLKKAILDREKVRRRIIEIDKELAKGK